MALTDQEKERIYYHLGYPEVVISNGLAPSIQLGIPRPVQTAFLVGQAVEGTIPLNTYTEERIRSVLSIMDGLEQQLVGAACTLAAEQLGELKLRGAKCGETFPDLLEREYVRWGYRLADILGVPVYAYSERYKGGRCKGGAYSIPVRR